MGKSKTTVFPGDAKCTRPLPEGDAPLAAALLSGATNIAEESTGFSFFVACKGVDAASALLACRTPAEFVEIQARFARELTSAWADEGARLTSVYFDALAGRPCEGGIEILQPDRPEIAKAA